MDSIGSDLAQAYDDGYKDGLRDNATSVTEKIETLKAERDRFKARLEAAEKDIQQMLRSDEACDLCVFCKCLYDECCACSTGAEWRGPQEGANQ